MLTLNLLHRQLLHRVLRGREMPPIDPRLVRVIPGDAKGGEQGAEFQNRRILPRAHHIGKHSARAMIERVPEPPRTLFGAGETPHLIDFGCASCRGADGA
jgi:hypothetical protein